MADSKLLVLGLESSCDDTAAAVLRVSTETDTEILSSVVSGQTDLHKDFGVWFLKSRQERMQKCLICV